MDAFRLVATVIVMAGVVVAILLFERRRADRITRDTQDMARGPPPADEAEDDDTEGVEARSGTSSERKRDAAGRGLQSGPPPGALSVGLH